MRFEKRSQPLWCVGEGSKSIQIYESVNDFRKDFGGSGH